MKKENLSYEEAMARLEELVRRIEANETGIDRLAGELKEAQRLVQRRAFFLLNDKFFAENAFKIIKFCNFVFQNEI